MKSPFRSIRLASWVPVFALLVVLPSRGIADPPGTGFTLTFDDEFNGTSLNTSAWTCTTGGRLDGLNLPANVSVSGGALHIALKAESQGGYSYTSGGVISTTSYQYGYYETNAQLPDLPGWHSSFWLMGTGSGEGSGDNELDIFENDSYETSEFWTNLHYHNMDDPPCPDMSFECPPSICPDLSADYHVYGMEWQPCMVNVYLDGNLTRTFRYPPPHYPQNVRLTSVAYIDGHTIQGDTSVSYDYVRYYSKAYPLQTMVVNGEDGYTENGTWTTSTLPGFAEVNSRYIASPVGSYAQWTPDIPSTGFYTVQLYKVAHSGSDTHAKIDIVHDGATSTQYVDFTSGSSGWVSLGTYSFSAGTGSYVRNTLNTASTTARASGVWFIQPTQVVVDNGQAGYTESGTWNTSSVTGYEGSNTRYCANTVGAYAQWTPSIPTAGTYEVYLYKIAYPGSDTNAKIDIVHNGGTDTRYVDFTSGSSGWVDLGSYSFNAGTGGYVRNTLNTAWTTARADAVCFVQQ